MTPVHDGLGISEAHWSTFMKIISDGMDEKKRMIPFGQLTSRSATGRP